MNDKNFDNYISKLPWFIKNKDKLPKEFVDGLKKPISKEGFDNRFYPSEKNGYECLKAMHKELQEYKNKQKPKTDS